MDIGSLRWDASPARPRNYPGRRFARPSGCGRERVPKAPAASTRSPATFRRPHLWRHLRITVGTLFLTETLELFLPCRQPPSRAAAESSAAEGARSSIYFTASPSM